MSDTELFNKRWLIPATFKACFLYVLSAAALDIGQELMTKRADEWAAMSWQQVTGWFLVKIGGIAILVKAFYSNSSPAKPQ